MMANFLVLFVEVPTLREFSVGGKARTTLFWKRLERQFHRLLHVMSTSFTSSSTARIPSKIARIPWGPEKQRDLAGVLSET